MRNVGYDANLCKIFESLVLKLCDSITRRRTKFRWHREPNEALRCYLFLWRWWTGPWRQFNVYFLRKTLKTNIVLHSVERTLIPGNIQNAKVSGSTYNMARSFSNSSMETVDADGHPRGLGRWTSDLNWIDLYVKGRNIHDERRVCPYRWSITFPWHCRLVFDSVHSQHNVVDRVSNKVGFWQIDSPQNCEYKISEWTFRRKVNSSPSALIFTTIFLFWQPLSISKIFVHNCFTLVPTQERKPF